MMTILLISIHLNGNSSILKQVAFFAYVLSLIGFFRLHTQDN